MRDFEKPLIPLNAAKLAIKSQPRKYFSDFFKLSYRPPKRAEKKLK